jgi:hypothetical protein
LRPDASSIPGPSAVNRDRTHFAAPHRVAVVVRVWPVNRVTPAMMSSHAASDGTARSEGSFMDDQDVLNHIRSLVEEEHSLRSGSRLDEAGRERMRDLEVQLDEFWDLLRRREAREEFRQDPNTESIQPESVVEKYLQ